MQKKKKTQIKSTQADICLRYLEKLVSLLVSFFKALKKKVNLQKYLEKKLLITS